MIVSSKKVRSNYADGFGVDIKKVIPTGIPRTDIFFKPSYKEKAGNMLNNKYPFLKNKKVILYAPTFRGDGQQSAYYPYNQLNFKKYMKV
ncbi:CDP-glycerol glycerophosphotransferase family protein [Bacillus sp. N9]